MKYCEILRLKNFCDHKIATQATNVQFNVYTIISKYLSPHHSCMVY